MKKWVLVTAMLAISLAATVAFGQDPTPDPAPELSLVQKIFGLLYNPITLSLVGLAVQFLPGVRGLINNHVIPFLTTLLAWISGIVAPAAARLMGGPVAQALGLPEDQVAQSADVIMTAGFGGFLGGLGGAILQSAQGYLMQRMFAWPGRTLPPLPPDSKGKY